MTEAFVYDAVRTPFGKHGARWPGSDPTTLLPTFASSWSGATPALDPERIDESPSVTPRRG
jgi:acetyl-CoA acyltransferase